MPATFSSAGIGDEVFISILRDDLQDPPLPTGLSETFTGNGTAKLFQLKKWPVYDADNFLSITVGGTPSTFVGSRLDLSAGTDVYVEYDTGFLYFQTAPGNAAAVVVNHYSVQYLNRRLNNALYAGLKAMFPKIWQQKTVTFAIAVNQWEYALTSTAVVQDDFFDPRTRVFRVEVQEIPAQTERFVEINDWYQPELNVIQIPRSQYYSPGATVRVHYAGPYLSLADLESQAQHLPILYAKGKLMLDKEIPRARYDAMSATQGEQANPIQASSNAGAVHMAQFERELERLTRPMPVSPLRYTYSR